MLDRQTPKSGNGHDHGAPFGVIDGTHWIQSLNDGSAVLIRPLRGEDRGREEIFINRLSPESRRFRFMGSFRQATPELIEQLMDVDNLQHVALVAMAHDDGELRQVGISRYSATGEGQQCESAVTVAEDWRNRGLAVALMTHLIEQARSNGFRQMISVDAADNDPMRELADYLGFRTGADPQDSTQVIHTLDL